MAERVPPRSMPGQGGGKGKNKASRASMRHAFKSLMWPRRWILFGGLLLILLNQASALVLPLSTKSVIDDVIGGTKPIGPILMAVGAASLIQAISSFSLTRLLSVQAHKLIAELRVRVQNHVTRLPTSYFDQHSSGVLVSRIMSDVEGVRNLVGTGLVQLFGGLLRSAVVFVLLMQVEPTLTLLALVPLLMFGALTMKAFAYIRPIFRKRHQIHAEVTGRLTEAMNGIRVIKGFHAEESEDRHFADGVDRLFRNVKTSLTATSLMSSSTTILVAMVTLIVMGMGSSRIADQTMTTGDFVKFTLLLGYLVMPILQMSNIGTQITEAFAGLDRMEEILAVPREGQSEDRSHTLTEVVGDIRFEDVTFSYQEGETVLHDIAFHAPAGTVTALVGSSGSGKTTIAHIAASFLTPDRGRVLIDGIDMATVDLGSYRRHLGVVLQDDFLFAGTVRENILFARPDATDAELESAVVNAHVDEFTNRFEDGLETIIGERGVKLSGGQRQRVAIARALLVDPRVLILDEATSNLDTVSESLIQKSFETLLAGRTTFVIAHRLSTIRRADQILVIEGGRIVEQGRHDELMAKEGRYHELYMYQARI